MLMARLWGSQGSFFSTAAAAQHMVCFSSNAPDIEGEVFLSEPLGSTPIPVFFLPSFSSPPSFQEGVQRLPHG